MGRDVLICKDLGFIMLRKCASTSIKGAVREALGYKPRGGIHKDPRLKYFSYKEAEKNKLKMIAIIRNPEERCLSAWRNKLHDQSTHPGSNGLKKLFPRHCDFDTFLEILPSVIEKDNHIKQQTKQIPNKVSFMLNLDFIERDWNLLRNNFDYLPELEVHNKSLLPKEKVKEFCSDKHSKIIRNIYADDFRLYNLLLNRKENTLDDARWII